MVRPSFRSIRGFASAPIIIPIIPLESFRISLADAPRRTMVRAKVGAVASFDLTWTAAAPPDFATCLIRVTASGPVSLRLGLKLRALSRSWPATSSSMTPSGRSLRSR